MHDDVIKWKHFSRYWPVVRGIHWSPVNSPHKGQWCGALMVSLICAWITSWVNNREVDDLRRHRGHYDVTLMDCLFENYNELTLIYGCVDILWHLPLELHIYVSDMMTSSNGNIFRVTGHLCGEFTNSPVPGEFPTQRPVTRSFDVFFDLRLNKRLSKQSWGWWLKTLSHPLWRHRNELGHYWLR